MSKLFEWRISVSAVLALGLGISLIRRFPFPEAHTLFILIHWQKPWLFHAIRLAYLGMSFSTPFFLCSVISSLTYIFIRPTDPDVSADSLPPYPAVSDRETLFLVVG